MMSECPAVNLQNW